MRLAVFNASVHDWWGVHLPSIYMHCPRSSSGYSGMQGIYAQMGVHLPEIYIYICSVAVCKASMLD